MCISLYLFLYQSLCLCLFLSVCCCISLSISVYLGVTISWLLTSLLDTAMATLRIHAVLVLALLAMAVTVAHADFHIVGVFPFKTSEKQLWLVPIGDFQSKNCNWLQPVNKISDGSDYPNCNGGWIRVKDGACGWTGVTIRPSCGGQYFGKLYGGGGEPQGDCFWSDGHLYPSSVGPCSASYGYDRLVCYTDMCGKSATN